MRHRVCGISALPVLDDRVESTQFMRSLRAVFPVLKGGLDRLFDAGDLGVGAFREHEVAP